MVTPHPGPLPQGEREQSIEFSHTSQPVSVTESPWFWVMLFSLAGLAAVATVGPKFEQREASIEAKFHARERALGREEFDKPSDDATPSAMPTWKPIFTLGPIAAVLLGIAIVAMFNVVRLQRRRFAELARQEEGRVKDSPPDIARG
jgi:hypothetical protein